MASNRFLAGLAGAAADLVLPRRCVACRAPGRPLCERCAAPLAAVAAPCWPTPSPPLLPPPYAVAAYEGTIRDALNAYKERSQFGLAGALSAALAHAVVAAWADTGPRHRDGRPLRLVPVPTGRAAVRRRGHDPILRLAKLTATQLRRAGHPAECLPVLRQVRRLVDQAALGSSQRWINLAGALTVPPRFTRLVDDVHVLVVDDVITTGATLAEAARALSEAGARPFAAAAVAATVRRQVGSAGALA